MFYIMALWRITYIPKWQQDITSVTGEIPMKFCSLIKTESTHRDLHTGGEVCYVWLPCSSSMGGW